MILHGCTSPTASATTLHPTRPLTLQHFKNTLRYIQNKQGQHAAQAEADARGESPAADDEDGEGAKPVDWSAVDVVGGCLKMGIA